MWGLGCGVSGLRLREWRLGKTVLREGVREDQAKMVKVDGAGTQYYTYDQFCLISAAFRVSSAAKIRCVLL